MRPACTHAQHVSKDSLEAASLDPVDTAIERLCTKEGEDGEPPAQAMIYCNRPGGPTPFRANAAANEAVSPNIPVASTSVKTRLNSSARRAAVPEGRGMEAGFPAVGEGWEVEGVAAYAARLGEYGGV